MKSFQAAIATTALLASVFVLSICAKADTVTLWAGSTGPTTNSQSFNVPTNVTARVISAFGSSGSSSASVPQNLYSVNVAANGQTVLAGAPFSYFGDPNNYFVTTTGILNNLPIVVGPATITLQTWGGSTNYTNSAYCAIETSPATFTPTNFLPSNAVVIPSDGGGPVTIILESSVDLVTWTAALPGTYGTTSSNRFFGSEPKGRMFLKEQSEN
jgi:hypothetical protein